MIKEVAGALLRAACTGLLVSSVLAILVFAGSVTLPAGP